WGENPPETFSVAWTGYLTVPSDGVYFFSLESDDGSWLYVDDQPVVENGGIHTSLIKLGGARLGAGPHRVRLRYNQNGGGATLRWLWAHDGVKGYVDVPGWALSRRPASVAQTRLTQTVERARSVFRVLTILAAFWWLLAVWQNRRQIWQRSLSELRRN